ncbi:sel1 repeat family protein [Oxalobacter vibrioformis]|uniref:Sel1 repeat family protein n=1 Tax=Oxalobacter vibrioformis TaxID=933080 RepID=A0A9E9M033_9BURK|nr:tetratricopeptide repeat protein [Oxalobacter vibrioformis]WAW10780.1 sel1 repeat family protein [Oxalobacter vibrioformis]
MKTILKSFLLLCLCGIACLANANDKDTADKLYEQGKIKEALQIYLKPEYREDPLVQNRIGNAYMKPGFMDEKKSAEWFRKSAEQGNMFGQYNLGQMYKQGKGVKRDYQQAFKWFSRAAEKGNEKAMTALGNMYDDGTGVEKDEFKAAEWYVKAAEKGDLIGQCNAAGIFTHPTTIKKNYHNARVLLEYCLKGNPNNDCCLDRMADLYSNGWGVEKDSKKAHELRTKAATNGSAVGMYMLGRDFDYGIGVEKDPKAAIDWYHKAAAKDHAKSMYRLYEVYEYGKLGQPVDKAKAKEWKARAENAMKEQGLSRNALMDKFRLGME